MELVQPVEDEQKTSVAVTLDRLYNASVSDVVSIRFGTQVINSRSPKCEGSHLL